MPSRAAPTPTLAPAVAQAAAGFDAQETRRRFFRAIAEQLPPERVAELHLFAPLRQGGRESGVAVVAALAEDSAADLTSGDARARFAVYRACYRLTRKGPERGRWEMELRVEGDATLRALDEVVRGIQRRAGEVTEPERMTGEELAAAIS